MTRMLDHVSHRLETAYSDFLILSRSASQAELVAKVQDSFRQNSPPKLAAIINSDCMKSRNFYEFFG